jgi:hypothetical protein
MGLMRRRHAAFVVAAAAALLAPATAFALITEVGVIPPTTPPTAPSCPTHCLAVSRTTGFQVKVQKVSNPLGMPRSGTVVAWTISLGKPSSAQVKFFNEHEGGPAEAGIAILRAVTNPHLTYKLIAQSPPIKLEKYFGETAQFPLETTIPVKKGDIVALTVPTWAPALALGFGNDTSWRAARQKKQCSETSSLTTHTTIGSAVTYFCLYQTARLTYSATLISTP